MASRNDSPWTEQRIAILKTMFDLGEPSAKIAAALNSQTGSNFSENACVGKADRMDLDRDRVRSTHAERSFWQPAKDALLKEMVGTQISYGNMAKRLCCTRSAVGGRVKRLGLSTPGGMRLSAKERTFRARQSQEREKEQRKLAPKTRLVRSNGNSNGLRLIEVNEPTTPGGLRCVEVESRGLALLDLMPNDCRYPEGDGPAFTFCGQNKMAGSSYCPGHFFLTRKPAESRRTRRYVDFSASGKVFA